MKWRVRGLRRDSVALIALNLMAGSALAAAEHKAIVQGVDNKALREEIERAVGDAREPATTRIEARRRARDAQEAAEQLLRSEGYYDYSIETDIADGDHPQGLIRITLGPRTRFNQININWLKDPPDEDSVKASFDALDLKSGGAARAADVLAGQGRIIAALESRGYADAAPQEPDVVVDHADNTMNPTMEIQSGHLVHMDGLVFTGPKGRTDLRFVTKLAPWKAGQVYSPTAIAELERRLLDTGVYDSVTVSLAPRPVSDDPKVADAPRQIEVGIVERSKHTLDFSAGYSTSEGTDFDVRWSDYNRFNRADTLTYEARLAQIDSRIGLEWSLPHFLSAGQTLKNTVDYFRTVAPAYTEQGALLGADLTRRFQTTSYFTRGVSFTSSTVNDKETGRVNILTLRVIGALSLDRSDNPLDPRKGWKLEAHITPTAITGDESLAYVKTQAQVTGYLPMDADKQTVLAGRVHLGSIIGGGVPDVTATAASRSVPAADRFFAGGGMSVRGFEYQSIGPHYADNTPVGGLSLAEASVEVRHQFGTSPYGAVLFLDTGSVGSGFSPDLSHVDTAVGVGFRYHLNFAPIRADLAFPLQRPSGASQQSFQVYLSIGQSF